MTDPTPIPRRWADLRPEALRDLVDPTIAFADGVDARTAWALPAGWVRIVNRLHRDLLELLGEYRLVDVTQKSGRLRYLIDDYGYDGEPGLSEAVRDRLHAAQDESMTTCEVCSEPAEHSILCTRCTQHPIARPNRVTAVLARPPRLVDSKREEADG